MREFITTFIADYGYVAIFVLSVLDNACIPIPSEIVLTFAGALASPVFTDQALNGDAATGLALLPVIIVAVAGSIVGSWVAYGIGSFGGRPLIDRWGKYLLFRPHEVDRAHAWFEKHGQPLVFFGRMIPLVRAFVSLPAGVAKMNPAKFTIYSLFGITLWTVGLVYIGYVLGEKWETVEKFFLPLSILAAVILAGLLAWWIRGRLWDRSTTN